MPCLLCIDDEADIIMYPIVAHRACACAVVVVVVAVRVHTRASIL